MNKINKHAPDPDADFEEESEPVLIETSTNGSL